MAFGNDLVINIKAKDEASNTLNKIRGNIKNHSAAFKKAGKQMLIASAALTAGLGVAINQAAKFQAQMAQVSTMLDQQSMKYMPKFEKAIKRMSLEFGEGTDTLADGLYNILSASIPAEQAISVLDASVKAAKGGLTDTGTAADAITTILNSYQLSADRAADVSDLLFSIVKRGKLTFADLAPNIGKVSAMAANAGMSLEELGATISTLTRSGIRMEMAMTGVRGILNGMMGATKESATIFKDKLGLAMETATLKTHGFVEILKRIKKAGLTPEEIKKMFPNVRALTGIVAAMGDLEGITKDVAIMTDRAGVAQEAFEKNARVAAMTLAKLKQAFILLGAEIGKGLLPIVEKWSNRLIKLVKWYYKLEEGTKTIISKTAMWSAGLLAVAGGLLIVASQLPAIIVGYGLLSKALTKVAANALIAKGAMTAGLGAAIAFTAYKLVELTFKVRDYIKARKEMQEAEKQASDMQVKAYDSLVSKFDEVKDRYSKISPELEKQAELIEVLKDKYDGLVERGNASAEVLIANETQIKEKIIEFIAMKREASVVVEELAEKEKEINKDKVVDVEEATDAEKAAYEDLAQKVELLNLKGFEKKQKQLAFEKKQAITDTKKKITNTALQKKALAKLDQIYDAKSVELAKQTAKEKMEAVRQLQDTTISTLRTVLEAEGSSAKKKKAFIIALMTAELALGVTRMWTAEATKGVLGIPLAIAGTAALVANYGAQMHTLTKGTSGTALEVDTSSIGDVSNATLENVDSSTPTISDTGLDTAESGSVATSGSNSYSGGGVTKITNINVGGVDVNLGGTNVSENNLEETLREIGDAVKSKTVEAVTMAMQIYNTGKENEEEAV